MQHGPPLELLTANHTFPGVYQIKAIGAVDDTFVNRVLDAVHAELLDHARIEHSVRSTPNGRHVSLTLDLTVDTPEQVRAIYARIHELEGLILLL